MGSIVSEGRRGLWMIGVLALAACGDAEAGSRAESGDVPLYDNLGTLHYEISTDVPLAQRYFDQGLRLYYAFNHAEAIRAFNEGTRLDPECAMCYWGTALSYGPNINMPMDSASGAAAYDAVQKAQDAARHADPRERDLIQALAARYAPVPPQDRATLDSAYARAMQQVVERYSDDPDAATLYAESLMDLSPWYYWNADGSPRPDTPELLDQLERVMAENPEHPGANHFYIHAVEAVQPERAVPMAERLAGLMPGAGHIVHMPGHIYIRVGRYLDAIRANEHAVHADETYIQDQRPGMGIYTAGYYPHNYDFLAFAASMIGRSRQTLDSADKMASLIPEEMMRAPGMTLLQNIAMRPFQMRVRFGHWDEILAAPAPAEDLIHARAVWHYARGRALVARGDLQAAEAELEHVRAAAKDPALAEARLEFNPAPAVLGIATEVLAGHIAAEQGRYEEAVAHLREAVRKEDAMVYGEPPEWSVPVRHDLGAVLLDAGRAAEAEVVYREDLERFPENGWALFGLARSLREQGRDAEAAEVERRLETAWAHADVQLTASTF